MNEADQGRDASRREFVRHGFRYALLTGLAAVSALLFKRSGGKLIGQTCFNRGICSRCFAFRQCGLPPALSRKQVLSRSDRDNKALPGSHIPAPAARTTTSPAPTRKESA